MKKITAVLLLLGLVLLGLLLAILLRGSHDLSPGVTTKSIRAVALGMTEAQVIALLGQPLARETRPDGLQTMQFSRPVSGAFWYPMLWVHFREGQVVEIHAKRYVLWGADDDVVYNLNSSHPTKPAYIRSDFEETFPNSKH